jgi:hypothetical protein
VRYFSTNAAFKSIERNVGGFHTPGNYTAVRNSAFQMIVIEPDRPVEGLRRVVGGHEIRPNHMKVKATQFRQDAECGGSNPAAPANLNKIAYQP